MVALLGIAVLVAAIGCSKVRGNRLTVGPSTTASPSTEPTPTAAPTSTTGTTPPTTTKPAATTSKPQTLPPPPVPGDYALDGGQNCFFNNDGSGSGVLNLPVVISHTGSGGSGSASIWVNTPLNGSTDYSLGSHLVTVETFTAGSGLLGHQRKYLIALGTVDHDSNPVNNGVYYTVQIPSKIPTGVFGALATCSYTVGAVIG
jgi:hypothetical protein